MEDWQLRVIEEKKELDIKKNKLRNFFGGERYMESSSNEQARLWNQFTAMQCYSDVLSARIAEFK